MNDDNFDVDRYLNSGNLPGVLQQRLIDANQTSGSFKTEKEAEDFFCEFMTLTERFFVYRQVSGVPIHHHHLQMVQNIRCDVLLLPKEKNGSKLKCGALVIEVKKSGEKIGPGISQMHDYLNSVFTLENLSLIHI